MAWTAVTTPYFTIGEVVTATKMNALSDNLRYLKGTDGPTLLENRLTLPTTSGTSGIGLRFASGGTDYASIQGMDLGGNSYVFFGTNRQFDGTGWQQLTSRAGTAVQISQDNLTVQAFPASSSTPAERLRIVGTNGNVGIGTSTPQTRLHLYDTNGGCCFVTFNDILTGATPQVQGIIPDGSGDAVYGLRCQSVVRCSTGATQGNNVTVVATGALVGTNIFDDGVSVCSIQITAAGAIQVSKTAGVSGTTFKVALWITWL